MDPARRQRILEALRRLDAPSPSKDAVLADVKLLDDELRAPGEALPGDLDHYLRRRSYGKALAYLVGGTPEAGTCGRGS
ncbi:MAG: hypothetical protein ACKOY8_03590 [Verrucomicrobiota bacterium]